MELGMEFLLILLFLLRPLLFVVIFVWKFCYFWIPIDLLLHFEEGLGELHPLASSYFTSQIQVNKATGKGGRQPCKTSSVGTNNTQLRTQLTTNATQNTVASDADGDDDGDDDLPYPEECSSGNEDASVVECCSQEDEPQLLVVTASVPKRFNTQRQMFSSFVPEQLSIQVSPPVAVPKQSTSPVVPLTVREVCPPTVEQVTSTVGGLTVQEVCPPTAKEVSLTAIQETQDTTYNTRHQDDCDDSDDENDNISCDYQDLKEEMIFRGAQFCSSDTELDQAGKSEETVTDTIIEGNISGTSCVASTKEAVNQTTCISEEVKNNNNNNVSSTSTVSSNSAYKQSVDAIDQIQDNSQNDMLPDHKSPND